MIKKNNTYLYIGAGLLAYFFLIKPKIDGTTDNGDGTETVNSPPLIAPVNQIAPQPAPAPAPPVAVTPVIKIPAGSTVITPPNKPPIVIPPSVPVVTKTGAPAQIIVSPSGSFVVNTGVPIDASGDPHSGRNLASNGAPISTASTVIIPPTLETSAWAPNKTNQYNVRNVSYISGLMDDGYIK